MQKWVTWQRNQKGEGVVALHDDGRIIFPSRDGFSPPNDVPAEARFGQPIEGDKEFVYLDLSSSSRNYFAYPAIVVPTAIHGVIEIDGNVIVLRQPDAVVTARDDNGDLVITIREVR